MFATKKAPKSMLEKADPVQKPKPEKKKVAIILTNYNMPERTDDLCSHIVENVKWPFELIVVDNASDLTPPSKYTKVQLRENLQTTGGFLAGLNEADEISNRDPDFWLAYWFLITSAEFPPNAGDVLTPMAEFMSKNKDAVGIHPALTADSTTSWEHLLTRPKVEKKPRRTFMIDNISSLWRADWFEGAGGFDGRLTMAWGIDLKLCWTARKEKKSLWVDERVRVKKVTDVAYKMGRMNMSAEERRYFAGMEMRQIFQKDFGPDWWNRLLREFTEPDWL